ncbi:glutaredoxin family protein [Bacillus toyonensis]|uniref:glutaredoxin family protein n=1 Tax=Bacillus toyonensis TaxID=155322 RepID=UPI000BF9C5A3|nr:glutaredoxin family protein [Bacillus toyonensis]PEU35542.1 NrdH-redoxin [Bacillus toyonensis]
MATKIIVYTGNSCPKCKRAKEMFASLPSEVYVTLIERNVDENEDHMEVLTKKYNSNTLPTFVIDDEVYRGFDENIGKIMNALGL